MEIIIHRGTRQIGGCATELRSGDTHILIDMGSELPTADGIVPKETLSIPGATDGKPAFNAVFFTHAHGDHIGQIARIADGIPLYMGHTAKELYLLLNEKLARANQYLSARNIQRPSLQNKEKIVEILRHVHTFRMKERIKIGSMVITPYWIDHSDFDAYMFLIEAEGLRILHTGDFRLHGFRGNKTIPMLKKYIGQVDWLICEGTMLSREDVSVLSERELQEQARKFMENHKHVFVFCSSMNIDRIAGFIHAIRDGRPVFCDRYQQTVLKKVEKLHGNKSKLYQFGTLHSDIKTVAHAESCLAFIRTNDWSENLLSHFKDAPILYSMWDGYLKEPLANPKVLSLLEGHPLIHMHTSGHATAKELRQIMDVLRPRKGILPIHTEVPDIFKKLFPEYYVPDLSDGKPLLL